MLAATRIHLPEDRFCLTVALPAAKSTLQHIDLKGASEYLDYINLKAYDFCGPWSPRSGHHAQLYAMGKDEVSGSSGVTQLLSQGFPAKKILLGIPLHGRSFVGAVGPSQTYNGAGGVEGVFEYNQLPRRGCSEVVDKRHVAAQCVGGDGGFISYDNAETVQTKAAFCKQKGLAVSFARSVAACSSTSTFSRICRCLTNMPTGTLLLGRASRFQGQDKEPYCSWVPCFAHLITALVPSIFLKWRSSRSGPWPQPPILATDPLQCMTR